MLVASAAATALAALVPAAWTASAQADPVGDAQAQAALLAQKITSQQTLVDQLSERFDGAQYHLAQVQA
ncbi:MAG: hypothetical protein ACR2KC_07685, partial [Acidimicrobiales bacterium]